MANLKLTPIGDIAKVYDGPHATPKKTADGPIYLGIDAISNDGHLIPESYAHLSEEDLPKWTKRIEPQEDDIVFSYEATLGRYAIIPHGFRGALGRRLAVVRVDKTIVNPRWLYYYFLSPAWGTFIDNHTYHGSTVDRISVEDYPTYKVPLPDLASQDAAVSVLTAIDNKIANNKKLMAELEATARLIYDYWFTQFDFPDKNGSPYRSSGGKMVWSSELKREIPDEWQIIPVRNACSIIDCLHSKKPDECYEAEDAFLLQLDNLVDIGMLDLSWKYYVSTADYKEWTSRIELRDGDMVITNAGRVGGMARIGQGVVTGMGRNMTGIRPVSIPAMFMWYFFQSPEMQRQIANNTDSGSFFGSLNVIGIKSLMFVLPPSGSMGLLNQFSDHVEPLRRRAEALQQENLELMELRNWLLPVLMNGQATIGE